MNANYFNREPHKTCENYSLSASTGERVRVRCRIHLNHGWTRIFNREPCEPLERWVSSRLPVRLAPSRPLPAAREALTLNELIRNYPLDEGKFEIDESGALADDLSSCSTKTKPSKQQNCSRRFAADGGRL
jgi:hypothetical protein